MQLEFEATSSREAYSVYIRIHCGRRDKCCDPRYASPVQSWITYIIEAMPALAAITEPAPALMTRTGAIVQREPVSVTVEGGASDLRVSKC